MLAPVVAESELPLQLKTEAPLAPLAVSVTVPPLHIGPLLVGAAAGMALIVTEVLP